MQSDNRATQSSPLPMLTLSAVGLLALLFVVDRHPLTVAGVPLAPAGVGIAGLLFVAAALMAHARARPNETAPEARLVALAIECGLWAMALAFALRLLELAGG